MGKLISSADQIADLSFLDDLRRMPFPASVLMCPPDYFDIVDIKNPFMREQLGKISRAKVRDQWEFLRQCFEAIGLKVELVPPIQGCEDMVFSANQVFLGLDESGARTCVLSRMKFASRQREVPHFAKWFVDKGYAVHDLRTSELLFEGGGDAIWHPGKGLIWGGYGQRSDQEAYKSIADIFGVPVIALELANPFFYHLDTCFCPVDEKTLLLYPPALTEEGNRLARALFSNVLEVEEREALECMACNAASFGGVDIVLQRGALRTVARLRKLGFHVHEVETGEFIKSGGSVFCMKTALF